MATANTMTIELRNLIKTTLSDSSYGVYADEAPEGATYPYIVFKISKGSAVDYPFVGYLEVNAWDKYKTYSRVDTVMDKVEEKLRFEYFENTYVGFRCFDGERNHIEDTDKAIKRTREKFMIRYSTKGAQT